MAERFEFIVSLRDRFTRGIKSLNKGLGRTLKSVARLTGIGAAISAAFAAFSGVRIFGGALRSSIDFEAQLSTVKAVLGATADEIARVEKVTNDLGATTRFTATEAAQGFENLARAGQSVTQAVATIPNVLDLAQGNAIGLADAARIVTTTLNQFGLAAEKSGQVVDVLTRAAQKSDQNITELSEALNNAAPVARQAGISIEATAALIGKLADEGFRGERGGTALRNAIVQLSDPTSSFRQELQALGIESTNFVDVLGELEAQGGNADKALRALGLRAQPAITALVNSGNKDLRELIGVLNEAAGTARTTAEEIDANVAGALKGLSSAFDAFSRGIIQPLLGPIRAAVNEVAGLFRRLASSPEFDRLRTRIAESLGGALQSFQNFIAGINVDEVLTRIRGFVSSASSALKTFGENVRTVGVAVGTVVDVVKIGFNTLQAAVNGVVTTVSLMGIAMLRAADAARKFTLNPFSSEAEIAKREVDGLSNAIRDLEDVFGRSIDNTNKNLKEADGNFKSIVANLKELILDIKEVSEESEGASGSVKGLGGEAENAAAAAAALGDELGDLADNAEGAGNSIDNALGGGQAAQSADQLEKKLSALNAELQQLIVQGRGASDEAKRLRQEIERVSGQMVVTTDNTANLSESFDRLGIKSQEQLERMRRAAEQAFDAIVAAAKENKATQEDVNRAFEALKDIYGQVADGAEASSKRQIQAQLDVIAALNGVNQSQEDAGEQGQQTGVQIAEGAEKAESQIEKLRGNTEAVKGALEQTGEAGQKAGVSISKAIADAIVSVGSLGENVQDEVNRLVKRIAIRGVAVGTFINNLNEGLAEIQQTVIENQERAEAALDKFSRGLDKFGRGIRAARGEFTLLDDATLDRISEAIAIANERVQELTESAQSGVAKLREELARLRGDEIQREDISARIAEIEARIREARSVGNVEALNALREQLRLTQEIGLERNRQARAEEERKRRDESGQETGTKRATGSVTNVEIKEVITLDGRPASARRLAETIGEELNRIGRQRG